MQARNKVKIIFVKMWIRCYW